MLPQVKLERRVAVFIESHGLFERGMKVCVCFSGGMDSGVLLHLLKQLQKEFGIRLCACHFQHGIRGAEAKRDEAFCRSVCKSMEIPLFCGEADVPTLQKGSGKSMEEVARDARYAWFRKLQKEQGIDRFATAHHKTDQMETMLYRMIRGTTVAGLRGIPEKRDAYVRPLLCVSKAEIERYAKAVGLSYVTDSTNEQEQYTRNRIRKTLLPTIEQINPAAADAFSYLSECAAQDQAYLDSLLPAYQTKQSVTGLPMAILRRVVMRNYTVYTGLSLCRVHIEKLCRVAASGEDRVVDLPNGCLAVFQNSCLRFEECRKEPYPSLPCARLQEGVTLLFDGALRITYGKQLPQRKCESADEIVYNLSTEISLSCDGIYGMISYRSRRPQDALLLHGMHHSVRKLMQEKRVPVQIRNLIPVFYDRDGILCVPFVAQADRTWSADRQNQMLLRVEIAEHEWKPRRLERWSNAHEE